MAARKSSPAASGRPAAWRDVGGATAVESTGTLANGSQLRQLSVLKGQRFVSLAFLGPTVTGPDADRFFRSLKIK